MGLERTPALESAITYIMYGVTWQGSRAVYTTIMWFLSMRFYKNFHKLKQPHNFQFLQYFSIIFCITKIWSIFYI